MTKFSYWEATNPKTNEIMKFNRLEDAITELKKLGEKVSVPTLYYSLGKKSERESIVDKYKIRKVELKKEFVSIRVNPDHLDAVKKFIKTLQSPQDPQALPTPEEKA